MSGGCVKTGEKKSWRDDLSRHGAPTRLGPDEFPPAPLPSSGVPLQGAGPVSPARGLNKDRGWEMWRVSPTSHHLCVHLHISPFPSHPKGPWKQENETGLRCPQKAHVRDQIVFLPNLFVELLTPSSQVCVRLETGPPKH